MNQLLALSPGQRNVGDLKTHVDETQELGDASKAVVITQLVLDDQVVVG